MMRLSTLLSPETLGANSDNSNRAASSRWRPEKGERWALTLLSLGGIIDETYH